MFDVDTWRRRLPVALLGAATAAVYLWAASDDIVAGDNAEFVTLGQMGGAAHPTGYPLYVMWLRAMAWLPGTTPAHSAAIATVILGVAAVLVVRAAALAWGARPAAATAAAAMFAAGPAVLRVHVAAEVFALNDLIVALALWLAAEHGPLRGYRRAAALGLVAGLGISNHLTCVLVAPVGVLGVVRAAREARLALPLALAGFVAGLTPYLYLLVAPDTAASWGAVRDLDGIAAMIIRRDYGGPGAFSPNHKPIDVVANLVALARTWLYVPLAAGIAALGYRVARPRGEPRWGWAMLAASFVLAGPLLVTRFDVAPVGIGRLVCERFHVLPGLLLVLPIAVALDRVRFPELPAIALVAVLGVAAMPGQNAIASPAVEDDVVNLLRSLPERAIVIHVDDEWYFGSIYAQHVLGIRPDVTLVQWGMADFAWYRARTGLDLSLPADGSGMRGIVARLVAADRPVFVQPAFTAIADAFPRYPHGVVFRLLPPGAPEPSLDEVVALNTRLYAAFEYAPKTDGAYAVVIRTRYAETWKRIAGALEARGRDASFAQAKAREIQ